MTAAGFGVPNAVAANPRAVNRRNWSPTFAPGVTCRAAGRGSRPDGAVVVAVVPLGTVTMHIPYAPGPRCRFMGAVSDAWPELANVIAAVPANIHCADGGVGGLCR